MAKKKKKRWGQEKKGLQKENMLSFNNLIKHHYPLMVSGSDR